MQGFGYMRVLEIYIKLFKFINHVIKADCVFFAVLCKALDVFGDIGGLLVLADDVVNA